MADLGKNLLKLTFALLKHQAENVFGEEALGIAAKIAVEIGGEKAQARLESVLGTKDGAAKLLEAAQKADECFRNKCEDEDLRQALSIPFGDLTSVQIALAELPTSVDEDNLIETLRGNLKRDFPKLTNDQIELGVTLYADCLRRALLPLENFTLPIIGQAVLENKSQLNELGLNMQEIKAVLERVEKLLGGEQKAAQINIEKTESIPVNPEAYEIESWIQPLLFNKLDDLPEASPSKLSDLLISNRKMVIVGNSGSGKTYAQKMAANELNQKPHIKCFWIPLKNYTNNLRYTIKETLGWHNLHDDQVFHVLEQYQIALLLDGLNELTNRDQAQCINEIQLLLGTYQGHVCISYPMSDLEYFGFEYPTYKVLSLSKDEIEKAIKTFFTAKGTSHKADWFLQSVRGRDSEQQQDFDNLAKLPINLQFLLELADDDNFVYNSLRDLYGQLIQRRLERTKVYNQRNQVSTDTKTDCLMNVAYQAILKDQPLQMQKEFIRSVFINIVGLSKAEADLALQETIRAGLLFEVNDFLIEWPHASFRDYLAGRQLFNLVETGQTYEEFPLDKPNGFTAAAHATRLLTTQSRNLENRPAIFLDTLRRSPSFEVMKTVAEEYYTAQAYYSATGHDIRCDKTMFTKIRWGERFLEAYNLIKDVARKNNLPGVDEIPSPQGLKVFFNAESDFCLITFSKENGIQLDKLETFNNQISHRTRRKNPKTGFCLYAPSLLLLDPEIIAYFEVGLWLRTKDTENKLGKWHSNLAIYISPRNESISWNQDQELPEPNFEILASPEETMKILHRTYGPEQVKQIIRITDVLVHSKKEILLWQEIYMPITFQIDPSKTKATQKIVSNRLSQVMVQTLPDHRISLWLFAPFISSSRKIDRGIKIFIPFPVPLLNRYYFEYGEQWIVMNGNPEIFFHLRG